MSDSYLVLFDADKIKDYVFSTGRLKEIRGASEQVRQLTKPDAIKAFFKQWMGGRELHDWQKNQSEGLIYAGGGAGALLIANEDDAETFCKKLEQTYRRKTISATLTTIAIPIGTNLPQTLADAARFLAQRKASRRSAEFIPGGGFIRFCASDRRYPAQRSVPDLSRPGGTMLLSTSSIKKRLNNKHIREKGLHQFWEDFLGEVDQERRPTWEAAARTARRQTLNTIGNLSRPEGYVALVYADGDSIGRTIREVVQEHGLSGYRDFSRALSQAAHRATVQALAVAYRSDVLKMQTDPEKRTKSFYAIPFDVITIGGDDVILFCTAERGLDVACTLSKAFTDIANELLQESGMTQTVTASVGVVIAHAGHPIPHLLGRAEELLKQAKRGRTKSGQSNEGWIDFHIVSTPGLESIRDVRKEHYTRNEDMVLTARPYSLTDMDRLLKAARTLNEENLPGSKRNQLYEACMLASERVAATLAVLRTQVRLSQEHNKHIIDTLSALNVKTMYPFFQDPDNIHRFITPLIDLLEVSAFVGKEKKGSPTHDNDSGSPSYRNSA